MKRRDLGFKMVAEVVRLLGYTKNARILTNPATEILNGVCRWADPDENRSFRHVDSNPLVENLVGIPSVST